MADGKIGDKGISFVNRMINSGIVCMLDVVSGWGKIIDVGNPEKWSKNCSLSYTKVCSQVPTAYFTLCERPEKKLGMILVVSGLMPIFFSFVIAISVLILSNALEKSSMRARTHMQSLISRLLAISTINFAKASVGPRDGV